MIETAYALKGWKIEPDGDPENATVTYAALAQFGAPLEGIRPEDFTDRNCFFRFGREPRGFDILPTIPGVDFGAVRERRVETVVDIATGLKANFISAQDLIVSKLASGRPRDLADVGRHPQSAGEPRTETRLKKTIRTDIAKGSWLLNPRFKYRRCATRQSSDLSKP